MPGICSVKDLGSTPSASTHSTSATKRSRLQRSPVSRKQRPSSAAPCRDRQSRSARRTTPTLSPAITSSCCAARSVDGAGRPCHPASADARRPTIAIDASQTMPRRSSMRCTACRRRRSLCAEPDADALYLRSLNRLPSASNRPRRKAAMEIADERRSIAGVMRLAARSAGPCLAASRLTAPSERRYSSATLDLDPAREIGAVRQRSRCRQSAASMTPSTPARILTRWRTSAGRQTLMTALSALNVPSPSSRPSR